MFILTIKCMHKKSELKTRSCDVQWEGSGWAVRRPVSLATFPQAFDLATILCTVVEYTMIWRWLQHSDERHLPHRNAPDISRHQWTNSISITYFEGLLGIHQSFSLYSYSLLVSQTWQQLFGLFARNIICDILVSWSYSGDWQSGALCQGHNNCVRVLRAGQGRAEMG